MRRIQQRVLYSFIVAFCILCILCILFVVSSVNAASIPKDIGTEEAAFLKIDTSTRPSAMGGAFVGVANDVNAVFWNPAGLTQMEQTDKREFTAMYNSWLAGINYTSGAYSQPLGKNAAFAISAIYLQSEFEGREGDTKEPDSLPNVYSLAAGLSGSYALVPKTLSLGGTVKYIDQDFYVTESSAIGLDLGCLIRVSQLRLGASVQNITLKISKEKGEEKGDLPLSLRVGAGFQLSNSSIVAGEFSKIGAGDPTYHIGLEKWFRKILAIRAGYCFGQNDNPKEGLSAGLGLKAYGTKPLEAMNFQFDYAYVPDPEGLGDTHRVSMIVRF